MWEIMKVWASGIWAVIRPAVMVWLTAFGKKLIAVALEIVTQLSTTDLTNDEKRKEAFNQIKERLEKEGEEVTSSLINLAIEIAVQKLKE